MLNEKRAIELALSKNPSVASKSFLRYVDDNHDSTTYNQPPNFKTS